MAADLVVAASEAFAHTAADYIAEAIRAAAIGENRIAIGLSGGNSPKPVYQQLARLPELPWHRVEIYFADERAVAPDHPESNYRLVKEHLVDRLPRPVGSMHRMEAEQSDLARAAREYESVLPAQLDILVLGMGEDGHTASLFPHDAAVREERHRVLAVEGPHPPRWRLTITAPVIRSARATLMLVAGKNKAMAVARARQGPGDPLPMPGPIGPARTLDSG